MDLLSDVLRDLRLESAVLSMGELRAPWGFDKGAVEAAPFHVVIEGHCLFEAEGSDPIELTPGDLVVLPHGDRHAFFSDRRARRTPFKQVLEANGIDGTWTPGKRIEGWTGFASAVEAHSRGPSRASSRSAIDVAIRSSKRFRPSFMSAGGWGAGRLGSKVRSVSPGGRASRPLPNGWPTSSSCRQYVITSRACRRTVVADSAGSRTRRSRALSLVHGRPGEAWTVASLARAVALSRTGFAHRFRALVGSSVMEYVTARRMHVAAGMLARSREALPEIASEVGYESEVSFSKAFRRWAGLPPGQYRRRMKELSSVR
jgi:AraC-like DNA-binding protein